MKQVSERGDLDVLFLYYFKNQHSVQRIQEKNIYLP